MDEKKNKKTKKMNLYEEETGKNAIWREKITEEYKKGEQGEKIYQRNGERWTIYLKDKTLDKKYKEFLSRIKSKKKNYSQSQLAIDGINLLIKLAGKLGELGRDYDYESLYNYIKKSIDYYTNEKKTSKTEIYEDLIQSISPLLLFIQILNENINDKEKLIKIIKNFEKAIHDLDKKIENYFKKPTIQRFITKYDVLYVEDEELARNAIEYFFKKHNFTIKSVEKAENALYELKNSTPRLILIDIGLPGKIKGDKLCKILREKEEYNKIPIILITAKITEKDKEILKEKVQANDIILKSRLKNLDDLNLLLKYLK